MVLWAKSREKKFRDDMAMLANLKHEEIDVDEMTEDAALMLEQIAKLVNEGKVILDEDKRGRLTRIIKKLMKRERQAENLARQLTLDLQALSRRRM